MRENTRRVAVAVGIVVLGLLALGAVPSALGSGDSYRLVVTPTDVEGPATNATGLSGRRYPYLTEALATPDGRPSGYRRGRFGLKESFAHSPFDEVSALVAGEPAAAVEGRDHAVRVTVDDRRYRLAVRW